MKAGKAPAQQPADSHRAVPAPPARSSPEGVPCEVVYLNSFHHVCVPLLSKSPRGWGGSKITTERNAMAINQDDRNRWHAGAPSAVHHDHDRTELSAKPGRNGHAQIGAFGLYAPLLLRNGYSPDP